MLLSRFAFRGKYPSRRTKPVLTVEALEDRCLLTLLGSSFQISPVSVIDEFNAANASAPGALGPRSVVVWEYPYSDQDRDIRGQRLDSYGNKVGQPFIVVSSSKNEHHPAVAIDHAGNFVVAYTADYSATDMDIRAVRFGADGTPLGGWFSVAASGANEYDPSVAMDANGNFVVSYTVDTADGGQAVWARMYSSNGVGASPFEVYESSGAKAYHSSVARADDGRFAVAFELLWNASNNKDVEVRRYNAAGNFQSYHGLYTGRSDERPDLSMDDTGKSVLVFKSGTGGQPIIRAVRLSAGGAVTGPEIDFPDMSGGSLVGGPAVALDPTGSGSFAVVYNRGAWVRIVEVTGSDVQVPTATSFTGFVPDISHAPGSCFFPDSDRYLISAAFPGPPQQWGSDWNIHGRRGSLPLAGCVSGPSGGSGPGTWGGEAILALSLTDHPDPRPVAPPSVSFGTLAPPITSAPDRARAAADYPTPEGGMVAIRPIAADPPAWFDADLFGAEWS